MNKNCKECPHIVRNTHNNKIVNFSKRSGKRHNCHMTREGSRNLWCVSDDSIECFGSKNFFSYKNKDI